MATRARQLTRLSLLLISCSLGCGTPEKFEELPTPVRLWTVQSAAVAGGPGYSAEVVPRVDSQLSFLVSGRVLERKVEVGDKVQRGQLLARLDSRDYQIAVTAAQAQLAESRAQLVLGQRDLDRDRGLYRTETITQATLDRSSATADVADARLALSQSALARAQKALADCSLYAPFDGAVSAIGIEPGQIVSPGQPAIRLAGGERSRELALSLPESRLQEVKVGSRATVHLWSLPGRNLRGQVREISPQSDPLTRTFRVKLTLANSDRDLEQHAAEPTEVQFGMSGEANFDAVKSAGLMIPISALFERAGKQEVWIFTEGQEHLSPREVEVTAYVDDKAQIASGLRAGDKLVSAGVHRLDEKLRVREWRSAL